MEFNVQNNWGNDKYCILFKIISITTGIVIYIVVVVATKPPLNQVKRKRKKHTSNLIKTWFTSHLYGPVLFCFLKTQLDKVLLFFGKLYSGLTCC